MRLIDADILLEQMKHRKDYVGRPSDAVCLVEDAPTIEAEPVRRGRWINHGSFVTCSVCNEEQYGIDTGRFYCQNCGAKMEVENETN